MNKFFTVMVLCLLAFFTSVQASDYNHRLSVMGGQLHTNDESDSTFGVEYEFRPEVLNQWVGFGGSYERSEGTLNDKGIHLLFGTATLHPFWGLRISASLGESVIDHYNNGQSNTFRRYGAAYDYNLTDNVVFGPTWSIDRINSSDQQTFGISVGFTL